MNKAKIMPVILAGGAGARLSPLSTPQKPKPFLSLYSPRPLLAETYARVDEPQIFLPPVVIGQAEHENLFETCAQEWSMSFESLILEPSGKNTAPAFAAAALYARQYYGADCVLAILPCDHVIAPLPAFHKALQDACAVAMQGAIVTLGIKPECADMGLGYILAGDCSDTGVARIESFTEKPDLAKTQSLLQERNVFWNAGIYVLTARTALKEMQAHAPDMLRAAEQAFEKSQKNGEVIHLETDAYERMSAQSFDHAVMQKTACGALLAADFYWQDVGTQSGLNRALDFLMERAA